MSRIAQIIRNLFKRKRITWNDVYARQKQLDTNIDNIRRMIREAKQE